MLHKLLLSSKASEWQRKRRCKVVVAGFSHWIDVVFLVIYVAVCLFFFTAISDGVAAAAVLQTLWFGWCGFLWLGLLNELFRLSFPIVLHWCRSCRAAWLDGPMTLLPCSSWGTLWRAQSAQMTSQSCKNDSSCSSVSGGRSATR